MEIIKLSKPFKFEGKEYKEIDLSNLDEMTTEKLCAAERIFERSGAVSALKEMNLEYAIIVASSASGLPIEFFKQLPAKDGQKVKAAVSAYFFA